MIKLLFGRLLPAGAAVALFTSALSPLRPALNAFAVAANALAGDTSAGGQAMPDQLDLPTPTTSVGIDGFLSSLFAPKQQGDHARRKLEGIVQDLKKDDEDQPPTSGHPGALRPIRPPKDAVPNKQAAPAAPAKK